jgi:4-amino-4-deoxy-L-arabinose transferase-like glycosyltransferase
MGKVLKNPQILLAFALLYLCVCNIVWIHSDSRPPFWDAAYHQAKAIQVSNALHTLGLSGLLAIPRSTGYYPPLFHCIVAFFYALFGKSSHTGILANLPAIAVLLYATYGLGKRLLPPHAAVAGAVLVSFFPFMLWLSRETLIDYWLTSMVALAMLCLLETEGFSKARESVIFGVVCGLGMLTKWTFPIYVAVPAIWAVGKSWKNASLAALTAAAISAFWYWPRWPVLAAFLKINSAGGAAEGDPSGLSPQALIFYVRALEGYQLFLPLFILFIAGFVGLLRRFLPAWIPIVLWLASGWCGLLLFQNKDPRYSMPLLPAVALISAYFFRNRQKWLPALAVFLLFQHYLVSFGIRQLPERVVLLKAIEGRLSWDWNLYSQTYFRMVGPPAREDWKIEPLLARMAKPGGPVVKIGLVFNIPRFDAEAFEFYGALHNYPIEVTRLWDFNEDAIANQSFILLCEGDQGNAAFYSNAEMERQLKNLHQISQFILDRPERFQLTDRFVVPSGQSIRLYRPKALMPALGPPSGM